MLKINLHARAFRNAILGISTTLAFAGSAQAGTPFKVIDIPGAGTLDGQGTFPTAISGKSVVTGSYVDSSYVKPRLHRAGDRADHDLRRAWHR